MAGPDGAVGRFVSPRTGGTVYVMRKRGEDAASAIRRVRARHETGDGYPRARTISVPSSSRGVDAPKTDKGKAPYIAIAVGGLALIGILYWKDIRGIFKSAAGLTDAAGELTESAAGAVETVNNIIEDAVDSPFNPFSEEGYAQTFIDKAVNVTGDKGWGTAIGHGIHDAGDAVFNVTGEKGWGTKLAGGVRDAAGGLKDVIEDAWNTFKGWVT